MLASSSAVRLPLLGSLLLAVALLLAPIAQAQESPIDVRSQTSVQNAQKSTETSSTESFRLTDDAGTELLRLDPLGRLFIGDQGTPDNTSNILNIENNADSLGGIAAIQNADNSADPNTSTFGAIYGESNGDGRPILGFQRSDVGSGAAFAILGENNPFTSLISQHNGVGRAALFTALNPENDSAAAISFTQGLGPAHVSRINNTSSGAPAHLVLTNGTGTALGVNTAGTGAAGSFRVDNSSSSAPSLDVSTEGTGPAGTFNIRNENSGGFALTAGTDGLGRAASFAINNPSSSENALVVDHFGTGNIASFGSDAGERVRIENDGDVFADGTFNGGGADVAEAFEVEDDVAAYEPGDVLAVSTERDRTVTRAGEAYSTRVVGVYATKPGILLSEKGLETNLDTRVPMGIVGVLPTKVTLEGGSIERGDLLVTSSTPGHAMKGNPDEIGFGQVLGKALQPYDGDGPGVIEVMVNVK